MRFNPETGEQLHMPGAYGRYGKALFARNAIKRAKEESERVAKEGEVP